MLHVYEPLRRHGLGACLVHAASTELRAAGLPCFAFVRDDNAPSRSVFSRLCYTRVGDVKWCQMRLAAMRPSRVDVV